MQLLQSGRHAPKHSISMWRVQTMRSATALLPMDRSASVQPLSIMWTFLSCQGTCKSSCPHHLMQTCVPWLADKHMPPSNSFEWRADLLSSIFLLLMGPTGHHPPLGELAAPAKQSLLTSACLSCAGWLCSSCSRAWLALHACLGYSGSPLLLCMQLLITNRCAQHSLLRGDGQGDGQGGICNGGQHAVGHPQPAGTRVWVCCF